jgi:hypothetical protein
MADVSAALLLRTLPDAGETRDASHAFYVGIAVTALIMVFAGFAPSFFLRPWRSGPPLTLAVLAHGTAFSSWVVLFVVQTSLVASGRVGLHRRLGVAGVVLAVVMVASGIPLSLSAAGRGAFPADPLAFLLVVLVDLLGFAAFTAWAIRHRHRSQTHKRSMVLALASLLPPAVSRWPIAVRYPMIIGVVLLLFVATAPVADLWSRRRQSAVSLWGGLALMASVPLRLALAQTAPWHRLAGWLVRWTTPYGPR